MSGVPDSTRSRHLLVEYSGCDAQILDDADAIEALLVSAAEAAGATVVAKVFHRFRPQGVTGVIVIEESHLSIHTWPEHGYAALDFYTCGRSDPHIAEDVVREGLGAQVVDHLEVDRGLGGPPVLAK